MRGKTVGEVVAEVLMMRAAKRGHSFLVVEGNDDCKFWRPRVHQACEVINATGKGTGVGAARRLNGRGFVGHLGVFDRDYPDTLTVSNWAANEIYWDGHSLETILFSSGSFEKVIGEHVDDVQRRAVEGSFGESLRAYVQRIASTIGAVRYVLFLSGSPGDPETLSPFRHVANGSPGFNVKGILLAGVSAGAAPSVGQLQVAIEDYAVLDPRLLMRGHDIAGIISLVIGFCGGACSNKRAEEVLRVGFDRADLEETSVYSDIRRWEAARAPLRVLD